MTRVELDPGKDSFTSRCGSIGERRGSIVGVSKVVDRVHPSLVNVGVGALNPSVDVAALLLGRVDVLVAVGNVARLVLCLELAAGDRDDWSRGFRIGQLGVLGVRGSVLGVDNWRG